MVATLISVIIANSSFKDLYDYLFYNIYIFDHFNFHMIINDFLMAIFFLYVTLEIKKEVEYGMLSSFKKASFPIVASLGGVIVPAIIYLIFNFKSGYSNGLGAVISTDIAFAVGMFMIFKSRLNGELKIFLLSLAVVDDLIAIIAILFLYSSQLNYMALLISIGIIAVLLCLNKVFKIKNIWIYLGVGLILWYFIYLSGIHATISGVFLAMAIPSERQGSKGSIAEKLEHKLMYLSNLIILPLFAFANTSVVLNLNVAVTNSFNLVMGIILGLVIGKPLGVVLFSFIATKLHIAEKPKNVSWRSITEVAMLTGIGFTMAIFTSELAFSRNQDVINLAKLSIFISAMLSVVCTNMLLSAKKIRLRIKGFAK
ncbi:Na(+)/H(+) antiporter NhaA [Terrisporobacter glycolicus ATCC 14880 = DSM 1288]|uniref:Na(+)/H(+) antiporter NhaA n=2 Tax=Terrisporobacter glycolicus TaxID=36841 RepID=A0ABZ2ES56_9FIRM